MNKLDLCIKMQLKMIAGELSLAVSLLVFDMMIWMNVGFSDAGLVAKWFVSIPVMAVLLVLSFRVCRKLFICSVYDSSAALYQSLPLSPVETVTGKIFAAGVFFFLAVLPVVVDFVHGLCSEYTKWYSIINGVIQILIDRDYSHYEVPLFMATALAAMVSGSFAMGAAVQLAAAACLRRPEITEKLLICMAGMLLAILPVIFLNALPYMLLEKGIQHPAMIPAVISAANAGILLLAGRKSVKLLERA